MKIHFNQPYFAGEEIQNIINGGLTGHLSGNGMFTKKCHAFFEKKYGFKKSLLTTSCTDALEMASILIDLKPGDEIIIPSFTFVSSANPFVLRGAKIIFADSSNEIPNINPEKIEELITEKTKAIVVVHYAGVACDMDKIMTIAKKHNLFVIEDAAHSIDSYYKNKPLGSIGHFGAFSFHETKNLISGEGGMLTINDKQFTKRAEIIWEKGTNRAAFFRGEVDKYGWVDVGSSFLPSDMIAAVLFGQISALKKIQKMRLGVWNNYYEKLKPLEEKGILKLPHIPDYASNNGHMFYVVTDDKEQRNKLLAYLKRNQIYAVFHYLPLHLSEFYKDKHDGRELKNAVKFSEQIIRLPFYNVLTEEQIDRVVNKIGKFYK
ncbi:MAG: dTDP-4-amino-4,6-dideoxygalactose transaminase [Bacteroidales bacterium]|nr:dTDP-4-amino-4,6-dideoxygalactose transaminase [Bacteroidales bacterium]